MSHLACAYLPESLPSYTVSPGPAHAPDLAMGELEQRSAALPAMGTGSPLVSCLADAAETAARDLRAVLVRYGEALTER